jgi:hypothetical protein
MAARGYRLTGRRTRQQPFVEHPRDEARAVFARKHVSRSRTNTRGGRIRPAAWLLKGESSRPSAVRLERSSRSVKFGTPFRWRLQLTLQLQSGCMPRSRRCILCCRLGRWEVTLSMKASAVRSGPSGWPGKDSQWAAPVRPSPLTSACLHWGSRPEHSRWQARTDSRTFGNPNYTPRATKAGTHWHRTLEHQLDRYMTPVKTLRVATKQPLRPRLT